VTELLYLACASAFIVGLKRLGSPRTARTGNTIAAVGMLGAIIITLVDQDIVDWGVVAGGLALGTIIGAVAAVRVQMTAMPQMVAAFNGFGGIASALVAMSGVVAVSNLDALANETIISIALSVLIGAVTFSGSFVAFGKLQGLLPGRPLTYPGQQMVNGVIAAGAVALGVIAIIGRDEVVLWALVAVTLLLGVVLVLPIGGADMPVVISLLNSFSGLAAAATGFVIENTALIIGGALVGSAGLILTKLMTEAMNRPLSNVLFGAFGTGEGGGAGTTMSDKPVKRATPADLAISLSYAQSVVIVPGYGLAVAQAQHAARALADSLEEQGIRVTYAIHPVAGRMPGHMNVLLAEADVPYDRLLDLDQANAELATADVALILGANDVVNPSARDDSSSPIYGMPILEVDHAKTVVVVKRSLSPGFAGIDNPLFYFDGTLMLFSDAKEALEGATEALAEV
jgi:NAD(P) transhydrogenase subunit beta